MINALLGKAGEDSHCENAAPLALPCCGLIISVALCALGGYRTTPWIAASKTKIMRTVEGLPRPFSAVVWLVGLFVTFPKIFKVSLQCDTRDHMHH